MKGFKEMIPSSVNAIRNNELVEIDAAELVPGDIVNITSGNKIPADLLVIQCSHDAKVDNSPITGESEPIQRSNKMTNEDPLETKNLCFIGTLLVQGNARCMVTEIGDKTLLGRIAGLTSQTSSEKTPIGKEIDRFVKIISVIAVLLGVGLGLANFLILKKWIATVVFVIGIIVANVPEGLLATLTVSLTLTSKNMSKRSVLVKNLESVETLGSTSCICSDKTGTLTMNKMTVSHIFYDGVQREVNTHNPQIGNFNLKDASFQSLLRCATLCNNAKYNKQNCIVGDASESALLKFAGPNLSAPLEKFRSLRKMVHGIPFNSTNKWQLSVHETKTKESDHIIVMKGAPEKILDLCKGIKDGKIIRDMKPNDRKAIDAGLLSFAKQGERVLAFCELKLPRKQFPKGFVFEGESAKDANFDFEGFVFIGLTAMIDPPRPSVPASVLKCQSAGIRVFMVTGDHPTTARAIATKVNIINAGEKVMDLNEMTELTLEDLENSNATACVVTGRHINAFIEEKSADEVVRFWNAVMRHHHIVFSRTSPQHKLLIVEACQQRNSIVAVTGDGVNDSPALKRADIGIAMGIAGTDVAKEAADMILVDDNFSSIVSGVEEGRILFDNLKKSIAYTLSSNIPEIGPFIISVFLSIPNPLMTIQIFLIDLGTDMIPAISMSHEEKEADIMRFNPRNPKTGRLVSWVLVCFSYLMIGMMQAMAGFFTYFCIFYFAGFGINQIYQLDKGLQYSNCNLPENKYLNCFSVPLANGKYCSYSKAEVSLEANMVVINMDCEERKKLLGQANAAYVITIVVVQVADVIISKTRRNSVFAQGMRNNFMNFGIVFELLLVVFLVYTPGLNSVFKLAPVKAQYWILPLPFFMMIFGFDEMRKLLIRRDFNGWVKHNTYW